MTAKGSLHIDGMILDSLQRIEQNDIAPLFSAAFRDYQIEQDRSAKEQLRFALSEGTDRQNDLSQIALASLGQNMAFSQFLATFGLERDRTLHELQSGQNDGLLQLLSLYLGAVKSGNQGYID